MSITNSNIKKWGFAFLLALPVFYLYAVHFIYHDKDQLPTGFIQWEHIMYMFTAKEYVNGHAILLYQWPMLNNFNDGAVFFQPQFLVLGYLWKWLQIPPAILLMLFNFVFAVLALKMVIEVIELLIPQYRHKKLFTVLFCWGGGLLSAAGIFIHFLFFRGSLSNLGDNIFHLDPANGFWCLNFGRTLIYPLEAYYHFLFVTCIWFVLRKKFAAAFLVMLLLTLSHPYTAIEIIAIVLAWITAEVFYFKNKQFTIRQFYLVLAAFVIYFIFYAGILGSIKIYRYINQLNSLDWGYKIHQFLPAYTLVWLLSFLCVKNVPLLKKHFAEPFNRLFFWWGTVAFLLSVHGFAIKPEQPIHFTRGYIYAGFFLFSIPALQCIINKYAAKGIKNMAILALLIFIFLFDNITWFGYAVASPDNAGTYLSRNEKELVDFFKDRQDHGIVAGNEKNYVLNCAIQLYSNEKAWIPHPHLCFEIEKRREAVERYIKQNIMDSNWHPYPVYLYFDKNDSNLQQPGWLQQPIFENQQFRVFKIK
ncbi:MAG: hypothetical protein QM791_14190 [Ferruginibacter sp.]